LLIKFTNKDSHGFIDMQVIFYNLFFDEKSISVTAKFSTKLMGKTGVKKYLAIKSLGD